MIDRTRSKISSRSTFNSPHIPFHSLVCPPSPSSSITHLTFVVTKRRGKEVEDGEETKEQVNGKKLKTDREANKNNQTPKVNEPVKDTDKIGCTTAEVLHFFEAQNFPY